MIYVASSDIYISQLLLKQIRMASVEDLIATMNSGVHVGKQGYDLTALQVCF